MTLSNFPNGVSSFGVPIVGPEWIPIPGVGGKVFFVDSGQGNNANEGTDKEQPLADVDYAVGKCTANRGDVIICLPGHAETISAAAGWDLDVAGIHIIGIGNGADTPTLTMDTATTVDVDIDAAGITITNIHFKSGYADIAAAIDVNAVDFTLRNCRFTESADNENFLICIQDAAAAASDRITVDDCSALQDDAANTHFINFAGTGKGHIVRNNRLQGDWGTFAVGGAGVITFCLIEGNLIGNIASTSDGCIKLAATATGMVYNNHCAGAAAQANGVTATACVVSQNYYGVISEDLSAILDPIAT